MTCEADGILSLGLVDSERCALPAWELGVHIDLVYTMSAGSRRVRPDPLSLACYQ
jgi:hypothetical protein